MIDITNLAQNKARIEYFQAGAVIFTDGEANNGKMYILVEGTVEVYKNYAQQGELRIATLLPGEFFGEMSLFLKRERMATVVARENVSAYVLEDHYLPEFLRDQPGTTISFIQTLCMRLDLTNVDAAVNRTRYEQDLSLLTNEKAMLEAAANTDALTGAFNMRYFMDNAMFLINTASRREGFSYIAILDLDFFAKVNTAYGRMVGDRVLTKFSEVAGESVRANDIFARYNSDEFILLVTFASKADAFKLLERIREQMCSKPIELGNTSIPLSVSIGVAPVTAEEDLLGTIALAEQALTKAKQEGRNKTVFYEPKLYV